MLQLMTQAAQEEGLRGFMVVCGFYSDANIAEFLSIHLPPTINETYLPYVACGVVQIHADDLAERLLLRRIALSAAVVALTFALYLSPHVRRFLAGWKVLSLRQGASLTVLLGRSVQVVQCRLLVLVIVSVIVSPPLYRLAVPMELVVLVVPVLAKDLTAPHLVLLQAVVVPLAPQIFMVSQVLHRPAPVSLVLGHRLGLSNY